MKLLDVSRCHEDGQDFRTGLTQLEDATTRLEKALRRICSICEERERLAERDRSLTRQLIHEFEFFSKHELDHEDKTENAMHSSIEVMTTALKQLVDNQERLFEQINIGIMKPLQHFLDHDLQQVKNSQTSYQKARTDALQVTEKFSQCKRHEMTLMNELSLQLFDGRCDLHRASCNYALDLNCLHSKKTPHFLQKLVDYMISQLSFFHLGHVTMKDAEPDINEVYGLLETMRAKVTLQDTEQRTKAKSLLEQVLLSRSRDLVLFYSQDLHFPLQTARATIIRHLHENHADMSFDEKKIVLAEKKPMQAHTKNGYLWYAETRTFGTTWIRLFFSIRKGMLVSSESTSKVKIPISLSLNLCNVKPAQVTDTERSFCFKVTSPVRILILQAESTQDMQCWMEVLNNAIVHALHRRSLTPDKEVMHSTRAAEGGTRHEPRGPPLRKPKSRVNISKELYSISGNEFCADCGNSRPKWASINLGVLICIECSGVHRSLGVYVSQVRSLTLDTLKPEWVELLKEQGNNRCNVIYEELLPEDFDKDTVRHDDTRQEFITEKYVALKYTSPENQEKILRERQEAREESMRRSAVLIAESKSSEESMQPSLANDQISSGQERSSGGGKEGSGGEEGSSGDVESDSTRNTHTQGSTLQKVKKSLGTVKDSVVKFAKNE